MTNSNIDIDKAGWSFDNTYAKLPEDFLIRQAPIPVKSPELIILNKSLSKNLNLTYLLNLYLILIFLVILLEQV